MPRIKKKTWKLLKLIFVNKYFFSLVGVIAWVIFFDKDDVLSQIQLRKKLGTLRIEKNYYQEEIRKSSTEIYELRTNPANLEKFAREKYLMKKDNEDIFVILRDSLKK